MLYPCTSVLVPTRTIIPHSDRLWRTLLSLVRRFRYSSAVAIIYTRSVCFLYEIHKTIIVDLVKHPIVISSRLERGEKNQQSKNQTKQKKMKQNKSISMNSIQLKSVVLDQPTGNIWLNCLACFSLFSFIMVNISFLIMIRQETWRHRISISIHIYQTDIHLLMTSDS